MNGLGLLVGHLLGDYVLQNDWMAANKANPMAGKAPPGWDAYQDRKWCAAGAGDFDEKELRSFQEYDRKFDREFVGHAACAIHCLLYTLSVALCSFWWMPWWGYAVCFFCHWPIDRFGLARWWMTRVSGQAAFATGPLAPWSVVAVDNTFHLLTLFAVGARQGA